MPQNCNTAEKACFTSPQAQSVCLMTLAGEQVNPEYSAEWKEPDTESGSQGLGWWETHREGSLPGLQHLQPGRGQRGCRKEPGERTELRPGVASVPVSTSALWEPLKYSRHTHCCFRFFLIECNELFSHWQFLEGTDDSTHSSLEGEGRWWGGGCESNTSHHAEA